MLLHNKKVAIIGAGPAGLTMARLLQQNGADVNVYERDFDAQARISGGTLDLHKGSGQDALEKAGLLDLYYEMAIPMGRTVADAQGNVLLNTKPTPENQHDNPEINRNDLRKLLLGSLMDGTVVWDSKFTGLDTLNGKWLLHFEGKPDATADLVIGANGGMSKARKYITDAEIKYTGTLIIQGEIPRPQAPDLAFYKLCDDNILMTAGNGNLLVANPSNGGLLSYNVIFKIPEEWGIGGDLNLRDTDNIKALLLDRFAGWGETYQELLRATAAFILWPTRKISMDIPWKNDRPLPITLIGDAAHIMPPFAGQGANIGLLDALILAGNLTEGGFENIEAAIADYEQQMLVYATAAQAETSENELAMQQPGFSFMKFYQ